MVVDILALVKQARDAQKKLVQQGMMQEADIIEQMVQELTLLSPQTNKAFYTTGEAAAIIGVTSQTIKNWVSRGIVKGYWLGGRVVIPAEAIDKHRPIAEKLQDIDPLPSSEELIEDIRQGRRPVVWPQDEDNA